VADASPHKTPPKEHASPEAQAFRKQAEAKLRQQRPPAHQPRSETDIPALVHELEVHQIELEMQNEELQSAHAIARQAAQKYTNLFDFAPVGLFVLGPDGTIREVNLAGAALLGLERQNVAGRLIQQFVVPEHRVAFSDFRDSLRPGEGRRTCETRLLCAHRDPRVVLVEATVAENLPGQGQECRLGMIDNTERAQAELKLKESNWELTRMNKAMVGRELRMVELKKDINELLGELGRPPHYPLAGEG